MVKNWWFMVPDWEASYDYTEKANLDRWINHFSRKSLLFTYNIFVLWLLLVFTTSVLAWYQVEMNTSSALKNTRNTLALPISNNLYRYLPARSVWKVLSLSVDQNSAWLFLTSLVSHFNLQSSEGFLKTGVRPQGFPKKSLLCQVEVGNEDYNDIPKGWIYERAYREHYARFRQV